MFKRLMRGRALFTVTAGTRVSAIRHGGDEAEIMNLAEAVTVRRRDLLDDDTVQGVRLLSFLGRDGHGALWIICVPAASVLPV